MEFRVLGRLDVFRDGERLDVGASKQRTVLAALLISANETLSVDRLLESVWSSPPPAARSNLRMYLTFLRRALQEPSSGGSRLRRQRASGYQLYVCPGELDLDRFEGLVEQGGYALRANETLAAADYFELALSMWSGRTLDGMVCGPVLRAKIAQLEERRMRVAEQWARLRLDLRQPDRIVADLRALIGEHPLREPLWRYLMLALCRCGRSGEALVAYAELRATLARELGADPGPELQQLHAQILRGASNVEMSPL